jgi:hypothetical protein
LDASHFVIAEDRCSLLLISTFSCVRPEARKAILTTRAEVVARRLAHLEQLKQLAREDAPNSFGRRVLQFHEQKVRAEADWIHELLTETRDLLEREKT